MNARKKRNADLRIDLTSNTLDPRLTYQCSSTHLYWGPTGELMTAAPDVWPVEYAGGVAVGRHAPEQATTNLQARCRAITLGDYVRASAGYTLLTGEGPDGGDVLRLPMDMAQYLISQDVGGVNLVPPTPYTLTDEWQRLTFPVGVTSYSAVRIWLGRHTSGAPSVYLSSGTRWYTRGDYTFTFFVRKQDEDFFLVGLGQAEAGLLATSPVITEGDDTVARAASSLVMDTRVLRGINVSYSDGTTVRFETPDADFIFPTAAMHWGTRYMTAIEWAETDIIATRRPVVFNPDLNPDAHSALEDGSTFPEGTIGISATTGNLARSNNGLYARVNAQVSPTITLGGSGTAADPLVAAVKRDTVAGNLVQDVPGEGVKIAVAVASSPDVTLTGDGTAADPVTAEVRISPQADNLLEEDAGLYAGVTAQPDITFVTATGPAETVTPAYFEEATAEIFVLQGDGTTFTLDLKGAPRRMPNRMYRIRVILEVTAGSAASSLTFETDDGNIRREDGLSDVTSRVIYTVSEAEQMMVLDVYVGYGRALPYIAQVIGPGSDSLVRTGSVVRSNEGSPVTLTLPMHDFPLRYEGASWIIRVCLRATATDEVSDRDITLHVAGELVMARQVSLVLDDPFVIAAPYEVAVMRDGVLPPVVATLSGAGAGTVTLDVTMLATHAEAGTL